MAPGRRPSSAMLELRHLRYFLATAEELNYGRAAERLRIAQPGLSQQIKNLEEIVGTQLFDRTRRSVKLTLAGELFAEEARKALQQTETALLVTRRAGRGELGRIAIGYVGSAAYTGALTTMIGEFRKAYPEVELDISEMEMSQQLEHLDHGKLDIGFIRPPVPLPLGIVSTPVLFEEIMLALPENHLLAEQERVSLSALNGNIFITPRHPAGVSFHAHTTSACRAAGFFPRLGPQGRDFVTIASMVAVGLGVALVPQSLRSIRFPACATAPSRASRCWQSLRSPIAATSLRRWRGPSRLTPGRERRPSINNLKLFGLPADQSRRTQRQCSGLRRRLGVPADRAGPGGAGLAARTRRDPCDRLRLAGRRPCDHRRRDIARRKLPPCDAPSLRSLGHRIEGISGRGPAAHSRNRLLSLRNPVADACPGPTGRASSRSRGSSTGGRYASGEHHGAFAER